MNSKQQLIPTIRPARLAIGLLAFACLATLNSAQAQSAYTWNGGSGTSGNWSDGANWGGSGPSNPQGYLNFDGSTRLTNTNDFSGGSAGFQIYFKSTAGAFNLFGNSVTFYDFGAVDPNIQNEGTANTQTINCPIVNGNTHGANGILNINANASSAQGPLTFNGTITAADANIATRAINVSGPGTVTFNGVISDFSPSGKIALTQLGTGRTILAATNTFTGDLTISSGTVQLGNAATSNGSVAGNITDNASLVFANPSDQSYSGVVSGSGIITKSNAAVLTLSGANSYTGGTILAAGTLKLGGANVVGTGNITNNGATLDLNGQTLTNAIPVISSGSVITNSSGSVATISAAIGNASVSQLGSFTVGAAGNISLSDVYGQQFASTLTKAGAGTLTLGGAGVNGVSGNPLQLAINSGTAVLAKTGTGTAADGVTVNSGALLQMDPTHTTTGWQSWAGQINAGVTLSGGTFDLNGTSGNNNQMQWIQGTGGLLTNSSATHAVLTLQERGPGPYANAEAIGGNLSMKFQLSTGSGATFNFTGNHSQNGTNTINTGTVAFSGNNTMTGFTILSGGKLALNSSTAIGSQTLNISSGTIDNTSGAPVTLANNNPQNWSGSFTFGGTTNLNLGSGAVAASAGVTITANTNTLTVGGVVSGGANTLGKSGPGTLALSGNNTWGNATLNAGTLLFGGVATTATESLGSVTIGNTTVTNSQMIFSNTTVNITGANDTTIGGSTTSTNNALWLRNSTWNANNRRLQTTAGAGNAFIVDNSVATNFNELIGGNAGTAVGNTIVVTNGGKLYVNASGSFNELGRNNGAISNSIVITGPGSAWYSTTRGFSIGGTVGTTSNNLVQVNNGALWDHGGGTLRLNMGNLASGIIVDGGIVTNVYSLIIGNGANSNYVNVLNGGKFYCVASSGDFRELGRGSAANNSLLISGSGSLWNGGGATWTISGTAGGSNNTNDVMTVASSGVFTNGSISVGGQGSGHSLIVNGGSIYAGTMAVFSGAKVSLDGGNSDALYVDNFSGSSSSSTFITGTVAGASSQVIAGWQNGSSTVIPALAGNLGLTKIGTGTLTLANNANSYAGGTVIKAGTVSISSATHLGTNAVTVGDSATGADATLLVTANVTVTNNITVASGAGNRTLSGNSVANTTTFSGSLALGNNLMVNKTGGDMAVSGAFSGSGSITNTGSGYVFFNGPGSPNWTGNLIITAGTIAQGGQLTSNNVLSIASGAAFNNNNANVTIAGVNDITGSTGGSISGGFSSPVLTLRGTGSYAFSGVYSGVGGLNVSLATNASQTLSGVNTYTGATTINNGTLLVNGSLASGSAVSVNGGTLGGNGTVAGAVTVNSGGTLAPGTSIGTLALGSLALNSGSTTAMEIGNGPTGDKASASGAVAYGGALKLIWTGTSMSAGTVDLFDGSGFSGAFSSLQLSNWPAAYRVNTGNLTVDGSIAITANTAPSAQNITAGVARGESVMVQIIGGKHSAADADGDSISITAVGTPTSGSVSFGASNVTYTASGGLGTNTFTYTVTDAFGASDTKTVAVVVTDPQGFNLMSATAQSGNACLTYLGIPGYNYALDVTHDLPATNWAPVITNTAATNGFLYFTNPISLSPTNDFYRTRHVP